jgi:para-aminobenzoate synthetase component I
MTAAIPPDPLILVEAGPGGAPAAFTKPRRIIRADAASDVPAALDAVDRARADGLWLAGMLSYELGYALEPRLASLLPKVRDQPLIHLAAFDAPHAPPPMPDDDARIFAVTPAWDVDAYTPACARILGYICAGDIYQANLTFPVNANWEGTPLGLHAALLRRQPVPHGAVVQLPDAPAVVSRSPELFFATDAAGRIETRPMKGTAPRDPDPARDAALRAALGTSAKDRAENLMIVDLLRNDISRVCRTGSVRVPDLYRVETYATLHQMVSRITGELMPGTSFSGILRALFPCGSITGAPKIRAMEIIRELEPAPRGVYCGAVGWVAPDGTSSFNVAIRTLTLFADGRARFGVGGGIVHDSTPEGEYEEALWKARFTRPTSA